MGGGRSRGVFMNAGGVGMGVKFYTFPISSVREEISVKRTIHLLPERSGWWAQFEHPYTHLLHLDIQTETSCV